MWSGCCRARMSLPGFCRVKNLSGGSAGARKPRTVSICHFTWSSTKHYKFSVSVCRVTVTKCSKANLQVHVCHQNFWFTHRSRKHSVSCETDSLVSFLCVLIFSYLLIITFFPPFFFKLATIVPQNTLLQHAFLNWLKWSGRPYFGFSAWPFPWQVPDTSSSQAGKDTQLKRHTFRLFNSNTNIFFGSEAKVYVQKLDKKFLLWFVQSRWLPSVKRVTSLDADNFLLPVRPGECWHGRCIFFTVYVFMSWLLFFFCRHWSTGFSACALICWSAWNSFSLFFGNIYFSFLNRGMGQGLWNWNFWKGLVSFFLCQKLLADVSWIVIDIPFEGGVKRDRRGKGEEENFKSVIGSVSIIKKKQLHKW